MIRGIIGAVLGVVVALAAVTGFDMLSHVIHAPPPGLDINDKAALAAYMATVPTAALAVIAAGWFFAPFLGAIVALMIARHSLAGWVVASVFLMAAVANLMLLPHPQWMAAAAFVLPGLAGLMAQGFMGGRIED